MYESQTTKIKVHLRALTVFRRCWHGYSWRSTPRTVHSNNFTGILCPWSKPRQCVALLRRVAATDLTIAIRRDGTGERVASDPAIPLRWLRRGPSKFHHSRGPCCKLHTNGRACGSYGHVYGKRNYMELNFYKKCGIVSQLTNFYCIE